MDPGCVTPARALSGIVAGTKYGRVPEASETGGMKPPPNPHCRRGLLRDHHLHCLAVPRISPKRASSTAISIHVDTNLSPMPIRRSSWTLSKSGTRSHAPATQHDRRGWTARGSMPPCAVNLPGPLFSDSFMLAAYYSVDSGSIGATTIPLQSRPGWSRP